jgi:hypothetical protein
MEGGDEGDGEKQKTLTHSWENHDVYYGNGNYSLQAAHAMMRVVLDP